MIWKNDKGFRIPLSLSEGKPPRRFAQGAQIEEVPGVGSIIGAGTASLRDAAEHFSSNFARSQWKSGNECNSIALTIIHDIVPFPVGKAIAVLYGDDWENLPRSLDVLLRDVG